MNRLRREHRASLSAAEVRRKKLIEIVMNGVAPSEVHDEMNVNAARREELKAKLAAANEPPALLHPEMARIYCAKVTELARALQEPESRSEATEALRGLVDAIVLTPDKRGETLQIDLRGNLAAMLGAKPPRHLPVWLGRLIAGEHLVVMMTQVRGGSNAKAKREFGWQPAHPSWRQGFAEVLRQRRAAAH